MPAHPLVHLNHTQEFRKISLKNLLLPGLPPLGPEVATGTIRQLEANLRHLVQGYDSEATESSSGGESCDEADRFPHSNTAYVAIKKRAKYTWLSNRADIASKWTWLTAQGRWDTIFRGFSQTSVTSP